MAGPRAPSTSGPAHAAVRALMPMMGWRRLPWKDAHRLEAIMAKHPKLLHTAIDTTDARARAEFYRQLLGLQYR
jgi:hypothetical protein